MCGWSLLKPWNSLNTRKNTSSIGLESSRAPDLLSMLNRMTSELFCAAFWMSARIIESWILVSSKKSAACFLSPLGDVDSTLASRYDKIFRKCDLPEPKKPEIQTPILSSRDLSFSEVEKTSKNSLKCWSSSLVTTYSSSST